MKSQRGGGQPLRRCGAAVRCGCAGGAVRGLCLRLARERRHVRGGTWAAQAASHPISNPEIETDGLRRKGQKQRPWLGFAQFPSPFHSCRRRPAPSSRQWSSPRSSASVPFLRLLLLIRCQPSELLVAPSRTLGATQQGPGSFLLPLGADLLLLIPQDQTPSLSSPVPTLDTRSIRRHARCAPNLIADTAAAALASPPTP